MAEKEVEQTEDREEEDTQYKAPKYETVDSLMDKDAEDESLRKYKEALLGSQLDTKPFPNNPDTVVIKEISLVVDGRDDVTVDIPEDHKEAKEKLKKEPFGIKEGSQYRIRIKFYVNRKEIVSGLKYEQKVYKNKIKVDSDKYMMGSYGPSKDADTPHIYLTPVDDAPSGMLGRGNYKIELKFVDDDKNTHLELPFHIEVKKDW